jgi:ferredoxin
MTSTASDVALAVDMVRCAGHGICAWVFPDRIRLDEWGFAQIDPTPVTDDGGRRRARRAAKACPRQALLLNPASVRPTV